MYHFIHNVVFKSSKTHNRGALRPPKTLLGLPIVPSAPVQGENRWFSVCEAYQYGETQAAKSAFNAWSLGGSLPVIYAQ